MNAAAWCLTLCPPLPRNDLAEVRDRQDIQRRLVTARFDTDKDGEGDVSSTVIPLTCQIERLHGIRLAEGYTAASLQAELQALIDANVQRAQAEAAAAADAVDTASAVGAGAGAGATVAVEAPAKPRPMRLSLTLQASSGTTQDVSEEQLLNEFLGTYCTIKGVDSSQFLEYVQCSAVQFDVGELNTHVRTPLCAGCKTWMASLAS